MNYELPLSQALAFVPPNSVIEKFEELRDSLPDDIYDQLEQWLAYFIQTWVGPVRRNVRRQPLYPVVWWNVYQRVLDDRARTNNSIEGWHRAFDQRVSCTHPSLRRLSEKLRKEQASFELLVEQFQAGLPLPPQKKRYRLRDARIKTIVQNYGQYEATNNFLRAIAHNI